MRDMRPDDTDYCDTYLQQYGREPMTEVYIPCVCVEQRRLEQLFANAEITPGMREMSFEKFVLKGRQPAVQDAYVAAQEYLQDFGDMRRKRCNSIALLGNPGSGKTHLLAAVTNELIHRGVPVLYFPFAEGMDELKAAIGTDGYHKKIEQLQRTPVLFVDDFFKGRRGVGDPTNHEFKTWFGIVNYRYLNHLPMLISSELTLEDLLTLDQAIGSRIYEMTEDYAVELIGSPKDLNYRIRGVRGR